MLWRRICAQRVVSGHRRPGTAGRMEAMCRRALKIGLPALAFTEHLNLTGWVIDPGGSNRSLRTLLGDNDLLIPEPLGDRVALLGAGLPRKGGPGVSAAAESLAAVMTRRLIGLVYTDSKCRDVSDHRTSVPTYPLELSKLRVGHRPVNTRPPGMLQRRRASGSTLHGRPKLRRLG
jgi:hypothetical protein